MWDLFKAETLRYRWWALAYALAHLLVLGFLSRVVDLAQQPGIVYRVFAAVYATSGLLLGVIQIGGYRRANAWLQLLHRPVPHGRVALALFGAGAVLLGLAIALPLGLATAWQAGMTPRVVDMRHVLLPLATAAITTCAYLAGGYLALAPKRHGFAVLILLAWLVVARATGWSALALQLLVLGWLTLLVTRAFKPDPSAPPRDVAGRVAMALPVMLAAYIGLLLLAVVYQFAWIMLGTHPNNSTPLAGGAVQADRQDGKELLRALAALSPHADAALWREQIALSEVFTLGPAIERHPVTHELTNIAPMEFDDEARDIRWVFSHDTMRFEGYRPADQTAAGEFGLGNGKVSFPAPVLPLGAARGLGKGDALLGGEHAIYRYDSQAQAARAVIELPAEDTIAAPPAPVGNSVALLSDRALYFYDADELWQTSLPRAARLRVALPGPIGTQSRIDLIELVDGYLIAFTQTRGAAGEQGAPFQSLLRVTDEGVVSEVARRDLIANYPVLFRYHAWWLSPAMATIQRTGEALFAPPEPLQAAPRPAVPPIVLTLALLLMLASAVIAWRLTRRRAGSPAARVAWIVAAGLIGLPALIGWWLLTADDEIVDEDTASIAAARA